MQGLKNTHGFHFIYSSIFWAEEMNVLDGWEALDSQLALSSTIDLFFYKNRLVGRLARSSNNPSFHGWRCKADDTVTLHWRSHPREQVLFPLSLLRYPEMYAPHFSICNLATIYGFLFVTSPRYKVITQQAKEIRFWIKNADL